MHISPSLPTPAGTWTPDPSQLLGEYEEPPPPRDTNAYFMTDNNTVVTVQVGMTADLRCQVFDVAEHETVGGNNGLRFIFTSVVCRCVDIIFYYRLFLLNTGSVKVKLVTTRHMDIP